LERPGKAWNSSLRTAKANWTSAAQEERSARLLARLYDRTLREVREINTALQRILKGTYGACEGCGESIPLARLYALPAVRYCKDCAGRNERQSIPAFEGTATPSKGGGAADASELGDHELVQVIREHLKKDGRIDTQELRIECRGGAVHLSGMLPSEAEHQILLQIVTDVIGVREVADRIQIEELLWEREGRSKEERPEKLAPGQEPSSTEDIVESSEEDKEFVAPSVPTPEEEE
jgi:RNA polymerase-binding transcription factor DksA